MKRYSGQTMVRMPPELHQQLAQEAFTRGISLNQLLIEYLRLSWTYHHHVDPPQSRSDTRRRNIQTGKPMDEDLK